MESQCLVASLVRECWQNKEDEERREVEEVKSHGGDQVGGGGHEVRYSLFHPGSGNLRDPGRIEGEKGNERFNEEFDEHTIILSFLE